MRILLASSEVAPLAKTGGLADVCGALPTALRRLGHEVTVVMPAYRATLQRERPAEATGHGFDISVGNRIVSGELWRTVLDDGETPVLLVHQAGYFDRDGLYGDKHGDFGDNCERFVFFCRAVMETIGVLGGVELIHCNDWQTGLIPAYLRTDYGMTLGYQSIASLMTVHNMGYQGRFGSWDMLLTGLDWRHFNWKELEFYGDLSLLKAGLVFADAINTVSPQYAMEIQESPHGCGLEGVLRHRHQSLSGIVNGIDPGVWNPAVDSHLARRYDARDWRDGKAACKAAVQQTLGLPQRPDAPLIGLIGRLAQQKGWDLTEQLIAHWARHEEVQWAVLGSGEPRFEESLSRLANEYPLRVGLRLGFSDELAHQIEAGADMFAMPSLYEPCGLNQLYSLAYGTPPVVRSTGGLIDTVVDADEQHLAEGVATGFRFDDYSVEALDAALRRALALWRERPEKWARIVETGMSQDWSWTRSAQRYSELYESILKRRAHG